MNRNFGLKALALAAFAAGFLLTSSPAQAGSVSLSCPSGIKYAKAFVVLDNPSQGPYEMHCGSGSPTGVRTGKFTTTATSATATYTIEIPGNTVQGEPQGQNGACPTTTQAIPFTATCAGGVTTSLKGVPSVKLVIR